MRGLSSEGHFLVALSHLYSLQSSYLYQKQDHRKLVFNSVSVVTFLLFLSSDSQYFTYTLYLCHLPQAQHLKKGLWNLESLCHHCCSICLKCSFLMGKNPWICRSKVHAVPRPSFLMRLCVCLAPQRYQSASLWLDAARTHQQVAGTS